MFDFSKPDKELWDKLTEDRHLYLGADWWYMSGYADARAGYKRDSVYQGGTVNYRGAKDDEKAAYDQGYEDGTHDSFRYDCWACGKPIAPAKAPRALCGMCATVGN